MPHNTVGCVSEMFDGPSLTHAKYASHCKTSTMSGFVLTNTTWTEVSGHVFPAPLPQVHKIKYLKSAFTNICERSGQSKELSDFFFFFCSWTKLIVTIYIVKQYAA